MKDIISFDKINSMLREFFRDKKGFIDIPVQSRLSILAACEDPSTVSQFIFGGQNYPLPQTGQMWLEYELLKNPEVKGVFCMSTSYRNEPFPVEGRHDKIFPMFEFESKGGIEDLIKLERELLEHLGFNEKTFKISYNDACSKYETNTLEDEHEKKLQEDFGNIVFLTEFPHRTHPFWNMKHKNNNIFNKVDVLLYGMETFGSAERSINKEEMRDNFMNISEGKYAGLLFSSFGEFRVLKELDDYLSLDMFPRFGGGIGITRLARAMKLSKIIE